MSSTDFLALSKVFKLTQNRATITSSLFSTAAERK